MAAGILACWAFHWVDIRFTTSLNNSHLVWEGFSSLWGLTWQKFLQSRSSATRFAPATVSRNGSESCLCPHKRTRTMTQSFLTFPMSVDLSNQNADFFPFQDFG